MTPMARTSPWSAAINEVARRALRAQTGWESDDGQGAGWNSWMPMTKLKANRTPACVVEEFRDARAIMD